MENLKCFSDHVSTHASVDFIDACETLRKELLKSMKIAKKLKIGRASCRERVCSTV